MATATEGHPSAAHTLATGGGLRLVSSVVGLLGGLVVTAMLVRTIGLEQFGAYALALSLTSLLAIVAEMGIGTGATRMAAPSS